MNGSSPLPKILYAQCVRTLYIIRFQTEISKVSVFNFVAIRAFQDRQQFILLRNPDLMQRKHRKVRDPSLFHDFLY